MTLHFPSCSGPHPPHPWLCTCSSPKQDNFSRLNETKATASRASPAITPPSRLVPAGAGVTLSKCISHPSLPAQNSQAPPSGLREHLWFHPRLTGLHAPWSWPPSKLNRIHPLLWAALWPPWSSSELQRTIPSPTVSPTSKCLPGVSHPPDPLEALLTVLSPKSPSSWRWPFNLC